MDHDARQQILDRHATMLREHFDSVQILAVRTSDDGTVRHESGRGSWYERFGAVRSWVLREEEGERVAARGCDDD